MHGEPTRCRSLALTVLLLLSGSTAARAQAPTASPPLPPPGRLVDVGGWRLHLNCTGEERTSQPIVILEAGAGDFSVDGTLCAISRNADADERIVECGGRAGALSGQLGASFGLSRDEAAGFRMQMYPAQESWCAQATRRSASRRLSHSPIWFQLADVWLTKFSKESPASCKL
jgi:hypothetical protein